jgi:hypothetical protein
MSAGRSKIDKVLEIQSFPFKDCSFSNPLVGDEVVWCAVHGLGVGVHAAILTVFLCHRNRGFPFLQLSIRLVLRNHSQPSDDRDEHRPEIRRR